MRTLSYIAALIAAATACTAYGQAIEPRLSAKGEGPWRVTCQIIADGEAKTVILENGAESYTHRRLSRGACDYRAGSRADLIFSLTGAEPCPFPAANGQACELTVSKATTGSFKFTIKSAR
jgi:hypothetical protein